MAADVVLNGNTLELSGDMIVASNDAHEFTSKGAVAGFAFHDRANQANRYVLYAHGDQVRLWKDGVGDILSIEDNAIRVNGSIIVKHKIKMAMISGQGTKQIERTVETDLLKTIEELRTRVQNLESAAGNGRPKPDDGGGSVDPKKPIVIKR